MMLYCIWFTRLDSKQSYTLASYAFLWQFKLHTFHNATRTHAVGIKTIQLNMTRQFYKFLWQYKIAVWTIMSGYCRSGHILNIAWTTNNEYYQGCLLFMSVVCIWHPKICRDSDPILSGLLDCYDVRGSSVNRFAHTWYIYIYISKLCDSYHLFSSFDVGFHLLCFLVLFHCNRLWQWYYIILYLMILHLIYAQILNSLIANK